MSSKRTVIDYKNRDERFLFRLGKVIHNQANGFIEEHVHKGCMEITYFVKGDQTYRVEGKDYKISSGEIFITLPDEIHSSGSYPKDKSQIYYMIINLECLKSFGVDELEFRGLKEAYMNLPQRVFKGREELVTILEHLLQEGIQPTALNKMKIQYLLMEYILKVLECTYERESQEKYTMKEVIKYIDEHIMEPLNIKILAGLTNLSEGRFKANFRREVGIPPQEYILRKKVKKAKELLERDNVLITDVAYQLGFSSSQYFATVFKRFTAMTPKEYKYKHIGE